MNKLMILVLLLFSFSCASYRTQNTESHSQVDIKGGVSGSSEWSSSLRFERTSWYRGATLKYDILLGEVTKNSDFRKWFSKDEDEQVKKCSRLYISVLYANDLEDESYSLLKGQLMNQLGSDVVMTHFQRNLQSHYSYREWKLKPYKFYAFCSQAKPDQVSIDLPGHKTQKISTSF